MLHDTKLGLKHFQGWERMAIVSDIEWVNDIIDSQDYIPDGSQSNYYRSINQGRGNDAEILTISAAGSPKR